MQLCDISESRHEAASQQQANFFSFTLHQYPQFTIMLLSSHIVEEP